MADNDDDDDDDGMAATAPWALPHVHALTCTYGATSLVDAAPHIGAWIARLAPRLTAVTIAFDADAPVRARRARVTAAAAAASAGLLGGICGAATIPRLPAAS